MEIVVLYGGMGAEREVSLRSGENVARALREGCHCVNLLDVAQEELSRESLTLCQKADAVFLALHGEFGEDGRLQAALEREGVFHYTGSGVQASALAMQKSRAKMVVASIGIPVAKGFLLGEKLPSDLKFPLIAKPDDGGSSVGVVLLHSREELLQKRAEREFLCEEFLPGREYSVGVLHGAALPPVELCPIDGMYDYAHKYTPGATGELCPAPVSLQKRAMLQNMALAAFASLGLRDYARIDFKEDANGIPHFLEANTLPGMTETSLFPLAARAQGIEMSLLCEKMLLPAVKRRRT